MEEKENPIIKEMRLIATFFSGRQAELYRKVLNAAKSVACVSIKDVLSEDEIKLVESIVKPKECFRNAVLVAQMLRAEYVEGKVLAGGVVAVEHAFVKIGDKYIDPTLELAVGSDVTKETYVAVIEIGADEAVDKVIELDEYTELIPYFVA